jgi:hypothetical protein
VIEPKVVEARTLIRRGRRVARETPTRWTTKALAFFCRNGKRSQSIRANEKGQGHFYRNARRHRLIIALIINGAATINAAIVSARE